MTLPISVLVSGSGSNLQSLIDHIERGVLDARITLVVSNVASAYGLTRAENHGIPTTVLDHTQFPNREVFDRSLANMIKESGAEAVVLAGFMRILTPRFLQEFENRVINIHPALLPSFPGVHGQEQAADYGVRISGCTVHFVDDKVDHGPIIIQAAVPVFPGEDGGTLGARILKLEHRVLPQAVQWFAQGRLRVDGRTVVLMNPASPSAEDMSDPSFLINPLLEQGF